MCKMPVSKRIAILSLLLHFLAVAAFAQPGVVYDNLKDALKNRKNVYSLSLASQGNLDIPAKIAKLQNLQELRIYARGMVSIHPKLAKLNRLKKIAITGEFNTLPDGITELDSLEELKITSVALKNIPESFGNLKQLQTLYLANVPHIDMEGLAKAIALLPQRISLAYSNGATPRNADLHITINSPRPSIPTNLHEAQNIVALNLRGLQLVSLPESVGKLQNLENIMLSGNRLKTLPESIGNWTKITRLQITRQPLEKLPEGIGQMKNLKVLMLSNNALQELPASLGQLTQLEKLWLDRNQLEKLPPEMQNLENLQELRLDQNQLSQFPDAIFGMKALQFLHLNGNKIDKLPKEVGSLNNLHTFSIASNRLSKVPNEVCEWTFMTAIYLGHNQITHLPPCIENLVKIERFSLVPNPLDDTSKALFAKMQGINKQVDFDGGHRYQRQEAEEVMMEEVDLEMDKEIADETVEEIDIPVPEIIFMVVENMPEYPGGMSECLDFISKNLVYPEREKELGIEGTVAVQFVVSKDGSLRDIRIYPGTADNNTDGMNEAALEVVEKMPNWQPGMQAGQKVNVRYMLPIKFELK